MEKFRTVLDFCLSHQKVLGYSVVSLLTAGSERLFSAVAFQCPCNSWNMLYGSVFLLVPALILFLLGYLLNVRAWRLFTGCCAPGRCCCIIHRRRFWRYVGVLWLMTVSAAVAPLTWIAVALLGANFYECAVSGSSLLQRHLCQGRGTECHEQVARIPCGGTLPKEAQTFVSLQTQSQVLGWILIASIMALVLAVTCINRCRSPVSFLQLRFWKIYLEKEREVFERKAKEHATKLAERNLKCFFESTEPEPFQTPSNKDWQQISSLYAFNTKGQYYSMIHKYVSANRGTSIKSTEEDMFSPALGFVDGTDCNETGTL
ncbi:calcium homeostasis modulator protein 6-like [Malaclemys terrapin pileata]|uniref:calcium homeostasis modulator protein 6-like n=1 Tax=Malaclemys terrapin pileata TaxID=2991368 RepID=UPI0023A8F482|nr:calcium homeostasis modulator protein 6-like [Malaclemys terrapin pileata]